MRLSCSLILRGPRHGNCARRSGPRSGPRSSPRAPPVAPARRATERARLGRRPRRGAGRSDGPRIPRRPGRAVERRRRPRPRRAGRGRRAADEGRWPTPRATPAARTGRRSSWPSDSPPSAIRGIQRFFFTSGGAEANESAFKTARYYWKLSGQPGKDKVISRTWGYHGTTLAAMSATGIAIVLADVRAARAGLLAHRQPVSVSLSAATPGVAGRPRTPGQMAADLLEEAILREGADTVAGVPRRAGARRRRRDRAAGRLLAADPRDLRSTQGAA